MFNPNVSAYGRGIASNLVSEEERQRFNYGGRVGAWNGTSIGSGRGVGNYGEILKQDPMMLDWWERYSEGPSIGWEVEAEKIEKEKRAKKIQEASELSPAHPSQRWKEDIDIKVEPADIDNVIADPGSDQLFTDEEQKEKKSQMMLAMAERLVGGSRDKWGSKAQMENISGAIGDIRKIADPSERREMLAKYEAWGKAQKERDIDVWEHQRKATRDPEYQIETLMVQDGIRRPAAINRVYGTRVMEVNDTNREKIKKQGEKGKLSEGFIMEDAGVYSIIQNGKWKLITEEEVIRTSPRQKSKSKKKS